VGSNPTLTAKEDHMKNPKVFCPDCQHPWLWHDHTGCFTGSAGKDGGCECTHPTPEAE
jgi:hypothetical protein